MAGEGQAARALIGNTGTRTQAPAWIVQHPPGFPRLLLLHGRLAGPASHGPGGHRSALRGREAPEVPAPSSLDELRDDPDYEGGRWVFVEVDPSALDTRIKNVNLRW